MTDVRGFVNFAVSPNDTLADDLEELIEVLNEKPEETTEEKT